MLNAIYVLMSWLCHKKCCQLFAYVHFLIDYIHMETCVMSELQMIHSTLLNLLILLEDHGMKLAATKFCCVQKVDDDVDLVYQIKMKFLHSLY